MADKNELYSKEALTKLRSPERLDTMLNIVNPMSWITLCAIGLLCFSVFIWSIFGAFTEQVTGTGILLDPNGITSAVALNDGKIDKLMVKNGDEVKKGDILATIYSPETELAIHSNMYKLNVSNNASEVASLRADLDNRKIQKNVIGVVTSKIDGIVEQVNVVKDMAVGLGTTICTIRSSGGKHQLGGVFYVSAEDGHKIVPGMTLQLTPSGYDKNRDGNLLASVTSVSRYPVSQEAINKNISNSSLTGALMQGNKNACLEVRFLLIQDKNSHTGYLWTSMPGPKRSITTGAMVTGFAVVDRVPPIEKLFYNIRNLLRSR